MRLPLSSLSRAVLPLHLAAVLAVCCSSTVSHAAMPQPLPPGGILGLLRAKPFNAKVTDKLISLESARITLDDGAGGVVTIQETSSGSAARRVIGAMQMGQSYEFPQFIEQTLSDAEKREAALVLDVLALAANPAAASAGLAMGISGAGAPTSLLSLRVSPPFLANVIEKSVQRGLLGTSYQVRLARMEGGTMEFSGTSSGDAPEVAVVESLEKDRLHEFPDAIEQALLPLHERRSGGQRVAAEYEPLNYYIGTWEGFLDEAPQIVTAMRCFWRADGRGMWRVLTTRDRDGKVPPVIEVAVVDFDSARGSFRTIVPADPERAPLYAKWNPKARTFTSVLTFDDNGTTRVNVATFDKDGVLRWRTTTTNATAAGSGVSSGRYVKVQQKP